MPTDSPSDCDVSPERAAAVADASVTDSSATAERDDHAERAADGGPPLGVALLSISERRSLEEDGPLAEAAGAIESAGHSVVIRERVGKNHDTVQATVSRLVDRADVDALITTGGTSIEPNDVTIGAVRPLLDDELPAFETIFTMYACEDIGTHVVAARPLAGVIQETPVFCLPGNANATRLAMDQIISPQLRHLVGLANPNGDDDDGNDS